jgi:hypothetical protein
MKTKALITIDTEVRIRNRGLPDAFEVDVLGQIGEQSYGTRWIAERLAEHGFSGVFFLDVYGSKLFGKPRYQRLCERLLRADQTIELHTHPDQWRDLRRLHMHEYSLEDQTAIIRDGVALLKEWTGAMPIAHRAGRYGANVDTLRAIKSVGIELDSSFFYQRPDCKLNFESPNLPAWFEGVWELPVTVVAEPLTKRGIRFPLWTRAWFRRFQKLDVNCMNPADLCRSVLELVGKVPYVVLFLHSFSFTRRESEGALLDTGAVASFEAVLDLIAERGLEVTTFQKIAAEISGRAGDKAVVTSI